MSERLTLREMATKLLHHVRRLRTLDLLDEDEHESKDNVVIRVYPIRENQVEYVRDALDQIYAYAKQEGIIHGLDVARIRCEDAIDNNEDLKHVFEGLKKEVTDKTAAFEAQHETNDV